MDKRVADATAIFEMFNEAYFSCHIPMPHIRLSTRMTRCAGKVFLHSWEMLLSIPYHDRYGWDNELWDTVGHETVHLWLWKIGHNPNHTPEFKRIAAHVGVDVSAKPMPQAPARYLYGCPKCNKRTLKRRRYTRDTACGRCCRQYNGGKYSSRFRLILISDMKEVDHAN